MKLKASASTDYVNRYQLVDSQDMATGVSIAQGASPKGIANWFTVSVHGEVRELLVRLTEGNNLGMKREIGIDEYERLMLVVAEHSYAVRCLLQERDSNGYLSVVLPGMYQRSVASGDGKKTIVDRFFQSTITMYANRRDLHSNPGSSEIKALVDNIHALFKAFELRL